MKRGIPILLLILAVSQTAAITDCCCEGCGEEVPVEKKSCCAAARTC